VKHGQLSPEALKGVIEEFVTRDGIDYGESENSLEPRSTIKKNKKPRCA